MPTSFNVNDWHNTVLCRHAPPNHERNGKHCRGEDNIGDHQDGKLLYSQNIVSGSRKTVGNTSIKYFLREMDIMFIIHTQVHMCAHSQITHIRVSLLFFVFVGYLMPREWSHGPPEGCRCTCLLSRQQILPSACSSPGCCCCCRRWWFKCFSAGHGPSTHHHWRNPILTSARENSHAAQVTALFCFVIREGGFWVLLCFILFCFVLGAHQFPATPSGGACLDLGGRSTAVLGTEAQERGLSFLMVVAGCTSHNKPNSQQPP